MVGTLVAVELGVLGDSCLKNEIVLSFTFILDKI